jgi:hypothetical protein
MWNRNFRDAHTSRADCQMNSSGTTRTTYAFRLPLLRVALAALALAVLAVAVAAPAGAGPQTDDPTPDLGDCQELQVPQGNEVAFHAFGEGVQIYRWDGTAWIFVAPQAVLFADAGHDGVVGIHFGGPTWESLSGSKVVGTVVDHCTPDPDAIPWLLLTAASTEEPGIFEHLTYVQRLNTVGGIAPAGPGAFIGQVARVPYTSDYFFYRAHP